MRSVWELLKQTARGWSDINAPRLGASLSFYAMLSMAPLLVVCIGLAGLVFGPAAAQGQVAEQVQNVVGSRGGQVVQTLLLESSNLSSGLLAAGVGLFMLLFGASGVFVELRDSLNLVWDARPQGGGGLKGLVRYRFFSFALVLGIGFLLLISLLLSAAIAGAEHFFGRYLPLPAGVLYAVNILVSFSSITVLFALLYKVVPDVDIEWRDVWIGAAVTSLLFSIGKFLIGLYLGKASVGSAYGAAGSLVVFLVWVYYSAQIFFFGAEFTHTFAKRHGSLAPAAARPGAVPRHALDRSRRPRMA